MNTVAKRTDPSDSRHSFSAATFRKVLKGFEVGGLPYTEVKFQLKRLLATASPGELREVLRRSALTEPLPEYAYREVQSLLYEALEHNATPQAEPAVAIDQEEQLDPAALSAELADTRSALESEQIRAQEAEEALSERLASEQAVQSRLDTTLRELERHQAELRAARNSLASRDKVTAQMRQILGERDAELAAIRREHAELTAALESRADSSEQLEADLQATRARQTLAERDAQLVRLQRQHAETLASLESSADGAAQLRSDLQNSSAQVTSLTSDLAAVRSALEIERRRSQGLERSLTDSNSLSGSVRESLASQEETLAVMQQTLSEREAQLVALQREHAEMLASLKLNGDSTAQLQSDLQNSRAQVTTLTSDLAAVRSALETERRKNQGLERSLTDSNSQNGSAREALASQEETLAEMRQSLSERDAQLVAAQREHATTLASERRKNQKAMSDLEFRAQNVEDKLQAAKKRADTLKQELKASHDANAAANSEIAKLQRRQAAAAVTTEVAPASSPLPESASNDRTGRSNFRPTPRTIWVGAATLLLATAVWFVIHRPSPVVSGPAVPTAALSQPDAPVPAPTVPPLGQSVGSGEGENAAAPESPPHAVTTAAAGKPATATLRPKTDIARCRAGGNLDACYDAIRRRPSDPALLSALGDAQLRANRPADALRTYQRLATLVPNTPGIAEKIARTEAKISAKGGPGKASTHAALQTQSQ